MPHQMFIVWQPENPNARPPLTRNARLYVRIESKVSQVTEKNNDGSLLYFVSVEVSSVSTTKTGQETSTLTLTPLTPLVINTSSGLQRHRSNPKSQSADPNHFLHLFFAPFFGVSV